jgi:hypothetical protein
MHFLHKARSPHINTEAVHTVVFRGECWGGGLLPQQAIKACPSQSECLVQQQYLAAVSLCGHTFAVKHCSSLI